MAHADEMFIGQLADNGNPYVRIDCDPPFGHVVLDVDERMTYLTPDLADHLADFLKQAAAKVREVR
jgi:hypothetical protein